MIPHKQERVLPQQHHVVPGVAGGENQLRALCRQGLGLYGRLLFDKGMHAIVAKGVRRVMAADAAIDAIRIDEKFAVGIVS